MHCVVTGASGFIGCALVDLLAQRGHSIDCWSRNSGWFDLAQAPLDADRIWVKKLRDVEVIIHLAAHVHIVGGASEIEREQHRQINCEGTLRLAVAARTAGVRRFIFLSSAKVFGEGERGPYSLQSTARPQDPYAISKWNAEQQLLQIATNSAMEIVIIRPPLVYGPQASANFARLLQVARLPLPLPFAGVHNRRDMIGIDNLIDFIAKCIETPAASGKIWLCSDGTPYSLGDVIATIRQAAGRKSGLFSLPPALLNEIATPILGRDNCRRLFGNFEIDISATRAELGWSPPYTMLEILRPNSVVGSSATKSDHR